MRKLKVSLICVLAALLCCAFAAFIGIYAYNNTNGGGVENSAEITAPEINAQKTASYGAMLPAGFDNSSTSQNPTGSTYSESYTVSGISTTYDGTYYKTITVPYTGSAITVYYNAFTDVCPVSYGSSCSLTSISTGATTTVGSGKVTITNGAAGTYTVKYTQSSFHPSGAPSGVSVTVGYYNGDGGVEKNTITMTIIVKSTNSYSGNCGFVTAGIAPGAPSLAVNPGGSVFSNYTSGTTAPKTITVPYTGSSITTIVSPIGSSNSTGTYFVAASTTAPSGATITVGNQGYFYGKLTVSGAVGTYTAKVWKGKINDVNNYYENHDSGSNYVTLTIIVKNYGKSYSTGNVGFITSSVTVNGTTYSNPSTAFYSNYTNATAKTYPKKISVPAGSTVYVSGDSSLAWFQHSLGGPSNYPRITMENGLGKITFPSGCAGLKVQFYRGVSGNNLQGYANHDANEVFTTLEVELADFGTSTGFLTSAATYGSATYQNPTGSVFSNYTSGTTLPRTITVPYTGSAISVYASGYGPGYQFTSITAPSGATLTGSVSSPMAVFKVSGAAGTYTAKVWRGTANYINYYFANHDADSPYTTMTVIVGTPVSSLAITAPSAQTYTGSALTPAPTVKDGSTTLTKDTDYTLSYKNNTNAGTATVTITGKGKYFGSVEKTFTINKANNTVKITSTATSVVYGSTITMTGSGQGTLKWSSSDTTIATVNESTGVVTPVKQGKVTITLTAEGNSNYKSGTATKEITVQRKAIAVPTLAKGTGATNATVSNQSATTTYTGSAQHFTISSTTNITFGTPTSGSTRSNADFYATNAGTYSVSMSIDSNKYCWGSTNGGTDVANKSLTITIGKANQAALTISGTTTVAYNGTTTLTASGGSGTGAYSWSTSDATVATIDTNGKVTGKKPGTATITLTKAGDTNYNQATKTATVTVTKANQAALTISGTTTVAYNGTTTLTASGGSGTGAYSWATSDATVATIDSNGKVTGKKPGTATITLTKAGDTNYNQATKTATITVTKANQAALTISGGTTVVYGSTLTLTAGGGSGTGAYKWTSSDTAIATVSNGVVTPVKQGTVTITLNRDGDTNYNAATAKTVTITVQRKGIAIPTLAKGSGVHTSATASAQSATTTYNGAAQHFTISSTSNITFGTPTSGSTRSNADFYATNAGTYTVSMSLDTNKYCWGSDNNSDTAAKTLTLTINKAAISPTLAYGSTNEVIFSVASAAPTLGGNSGSGTVTYSVAAGTGTATINSTTGVLTGTKVGTVSVTVSIATTANYLAGSKTITVTVNPKELSTCTLTAPADQTYTGSALTPKPVLKNGATTLVENTDYTLKYENNTNAGEATVTITGKGNFTGTVTTHFNINQAALTLNLSYGTVTYGTNSDEPTLTGNSGNGTVTYSIANGTGKATIDPATGVITPILPGTVSVTVSVEETDNYLAGEKTITVTINKITPTATVSIMDGYYYVGDTLAGIIISVNESSVPGSVAWTNSSTVIAGLTGNYSWTFTPDESDYYSTITGTIPVTAYYKLTGITVSGAKTAYKAFESFDTTGMVVTATYATGKADTAVTGYTITYPTAGLTHFIVSNDGKNVTITYSENGKTATATVKISIIKADYDMSGVSMDNLTVTYDGEIHSITYTGTLPKGVYVDGYTYNDEPASYAINAGTYTVKAVIRIADAANYNMPELSATLTINKATPTATVAVMDGYYYVGDKLETVVITVTDSSVAGTVAWTNGSSIITGLSGSYSWTFTPDDSDNYVNVTGRVQVTAYYKLTGITVSNAKTMYKAYESFDTTGMVVTATYAAGKTDTAVTGYTVIYPTEGLNYFLITDDYKEVTISYTENGVTVTAKVTIVIDANEYDMSGVSMKDTTVTYDGTYKTLTYTGTLPEGVTVVGYKYDGELNAQGVMNAGTYKVEAVFEIADPDNYKYPRLSATLTIAKATPTATVAVMDGYYYVGDKLEGVVISVSDSSVPGTVKWTNASAIITGVAGSYSWTFTPDDTDNYKTVTGSIQVTAYYKLTGITVTGAKTTYKAHEPFDTTGMTVTASYEMGKGNTVVTDYTFTYPTEGLSYFITADDGKNVVISYTEGGITVTANVAITIDANSYDMTGVSMENLTVTYDGETYSITYTGTLPDGVSVVGYTYNGESATGADKAGTYLVEAVFEIADPDNYKYPKLSATLTINKANPTVTAAVMTGYYYVGDKLEGVTVSVGDSSVPGTIKWTNASAVITGVANSYGWTFTPDDADNYNQVTGTVQVNAYYKLTGITVSGAKTDYKPYDNFDPTGMTVTATYAAGKAETVVTDYFVTYPTAGSTHFTIADDGKSVTITYIENGITATAEITITIDAKEYDMSGVTLGNSTVIYDGEFHTLAYTGTLPEGVTVTGYKFNGEYSAQGVKNVGIYEVEAVIEIDDPENYKMPKLSATLVINKATPTATASVAAGYYYVGDKLETVVISVGESSTSGTITWTNANALITGVSGSYGWTFTPDDTDNYKTITGTVQVAACYKLTGITVTGAKTEYKAHETFDTTGMHVVASYATGKPNTAVNNYFVTYPTTGLTHFIVSDDGKSVTISYTENGITVTAEVTVSIQANEYDMSGVSMDNLTVVYDGSNHTITLNGELPDGVTLSGYKYNGEENNDGVKNAGTYTVEAIFEIDDPDNYKMPKLSATLIINKATPTVTVDVLNAYSYVGDKLSSVDIVVSDSDALGTVAWTNANAIITGVSGSYGWTFTPADLDNYKVATGSFKLDACYKVTGITVTGAKTEYKAHESFDTTGMTVTASYAAGKVNTAVTDYVLIYPTEGTTSFVISDDGKKLTISYTESGITVTAKLTIVIIANEYDMSGVSLKGATVPYDGENHALTYTGELPEGVRIVGYTYNTEYSAHGVKDANTYTVEAVFEIDDPDNYKVPKLSATLIITKATPTATANVLSVYYYVGDELNSVNITVGDSSVPGTIRWTNASAIITGTTGNYGWTFTPDDSVNYNEITGTVEVTAYYKLSSISVTGAKTEYKAHDSFDPTGMTVTASYVMGKVDTPVEDYFITYPTAGLAHFVIADDGKDLTVTYMENGILVTTTVTITIDANEYDMSGVSMENVTVTYDGNFHTVTIAGSLPEGVTVVGYKYDGELNAQGMKNAGTYTVEAVFEIDDPDNYRVPKLSAKLVINQATPTATAKVITTYNYIGDTLSDVEIAIANSSVPGSIKWTNESAMIMGTAGRYGWTFTPDDTDNYKAISGTLQITAYYKLASLTVIGAKTLYKPFESFDTTGMMVIASYEAGKANTVVTNYTITYPTEGLNHFTIADDSEYLIITYTENGITATAKVLIIIDALEYDMTGVSMSDMTLTYDGAYHSLSVEGNLPDGVTLVGYKYNGVQSAQGVATAGTYTVQAIFDIADPDNYKVPKLSATLKINKATPSATANILSGYYYLGDELSTVTISVAGSTVPGTIKWTNEKAVITGVSNSYGWTFVPDDSDNYNEINGSSQVTAYYKVTSIKVTGAKTEYKPYQTFDTTGMKVTASYAIGKVDTVVNDYFITYPTAGLTHFVITDDGKNVTVTYTENGVTVTTTVTITIDANQYDMTGVSMENLTVPYDGEYHTITVTGDLPDGVTVIGYKYDGVENAQGVKNANTYKVEAIFEIDDPDNYKMPKLSATLVITKADPEVTASVVEGYYYVGDTLEGVVISVGDGNVAGTISWINENAQITGEANSYGWTFVPDDADNYNSISGMVQVNAYYKVTGIRVTGAKTEYKAHESFDTTGMKVTASYELGKLDTVVTDYFITYPTEGNTFFVTSDDGKSVTVSYTEGNITVTTTVTITIEANEYDMSGVEMDDLTVNYNGLTHAITLEGELPDGVTLVGYKYNGEEGTGAINAGTYTVEAIFEIDDPDNYKVPKLSATLVINKANPKLTVEILSEYAYVGDELSSVDISIDECNVAGTLVWTNASAIITGVADSYGWTFTPEDTDNYNVLTGRTQVDAYYKLTSITVTGAKDTYKAYESFDKTGVVVTVSYAVGKPDTRVEDYGLTYPTEGLTHFVIGDDGEDLIIYYTENGITVKATVTITIDANEYDMSGVDMEDLTVDYDGTLHAIVMTGDLPDGVSLIGYKYNGEDNALGVKNAGTYTVEAVFAVADPDNYKMPKLSATLVINKATPTATAKVFSVYYYVGDSLSSVKITVGNSSVAGTIKWTDANAVITGVADSYGWTFVPTDAVNYNEVTGTAQVAAYYKLSGLTVTGAQDTYKPYDTFDTTGMVVTASYVGGKADEVVDDYYITYPTDGLTHFVISDDGKNLTVTYIENGATASAVVTIKIEANEYDMTGVEMKDSTVTYNGLNHMITLTGELPEGVTLVGYKYNGEESEFGVIDAGTYTVEAIFEVDDPENYKVPKLSATLKINKAKPTATVKVEEGTYFVGDGLDTVKLTLSSSTVRGTVKWTDEEALIMGVTGSYGWTFVPEDSNNYETFKGIVQVKAVYKLASLTVIGAKDFYKPYESFDKTGMTVIASYEIGKADAIVTNYTITYPTAGLNYFIITDDGEDLIISYTENGVTVTAGVTIIIDALEYDMTGVSMDGATVTYDGDFHTLALTGTLPAGVTLTGYKYNGVISAQGVKTAGTYKVEAVFTVDDPENYKVPRLSATLTINKAATTATATVVDGIYFVGDELSTVEIEIDESSVPGTISWTNADATLSGATGNYAWTFTPNDSVNYNSYTGFVRVTACFKLAGLTVTGAKTTYKPGEPFDKSGMVVIASYVAGKSNTIITNYDLIYPTEDLEYFLITDDGKNLTISYTENGVTVTAEIEIFIDAYEYDMTGVKMDDLTVTYDGATHAITLTGNLPTGVTLAGYKYDGEEGTGAINAGTYLVEAIFEISDPENFKVPKLSATLVIEKAAPNLDVSGVETEYTYNGSLQTVESGATLDAGNTEQKIKYSNNTFTTVAEGDKLEVKVYVEESDNYLAAEKTVIITVSKKAPTLTVSGVKTDYVYDGTLQTVESGATVDNDEQEILYSNNTFTTVAEGNGLEVKVSVEESDNYLAAEETVTITVDKARVENSVTFTDKNVTYNGGVQTITVEGTLANDMTVVYYYEGTEDEFLGETDVKYVDGVVSGYKVTAHFICTSGNYYDHEDITATLTIEPYEVTENDITNIEDEYGYKGAAWKPQPVITIPLADGDLTLGDGEYTVTYSTEDYTLDTHVTVTITVDLGGNIVGTVEKEFVIVKGTVGVIWNEGDFVYNGTNQGVTVSGLSGLAADDEGLFTYTVKYIGVGETTYEDEQLPVNAGTYAVVVTLDDAIFANYKVASEDALVYEFEIAKADVEVDVALKPYGTLYEGGVLPELQVVGTATSGSLTVNGAVAWQQTGAHLALELNTHEYTWVFLPEDSENFNTANGTFTLTALPITLTGLAVEWRDDIETPVIYTSTTLSEVRQYLKVTGTLSDNSTVEIAGYDMKGDWGSTPSPATDKAGAHEVTVSYKGYEDNITVNYKPINIEEIWVEAATSDGITKTYLGLDEFDRDSIIVNVRFSDGTVQENVTDYVVIYDGGHSELWAGDEKVTISYHDVTCEIDELSVTKREYDLSGFDFGNLTYDYDGEIKSYELNGEFEAGTVSYTYAKLENGEWQTVPAASVKNAGTYMVSVKFELSEGKYAANYEEVTSCEVQILIKKVNYEKVEDIKFELTVADYDYGNSLADKMHVSGIPEGVTPVYEFKYQDGTVLTADEVVNAGKYTVTVSFVGDENHYGIAPVSTQFTVNKITPAVDPSVSGNLVKGTLLKQLTFMDNLDGVKGKYEWVNGEQELQAGVNRCYYVFNPDDAINYESVRGYIDLSVGLAPVGGSDSGIGGISEWWWIALVGITALSIILAICSIVVAGKKKPAGDDDGFYDDVTEADLM